LRLLRYVGSKPILKSNREIPMTTFKTVLAAAAVVALGASALGSTSALATVKVSTQSNGRGKLSDSTPVTFGQTGVRELGPGKLAFPHGRPGLTIAPFACQPPGCSHLEP
jgi:hypothetical protein